MIGGTGRRGPLLMKAKQAARFLGIGEKTFLDWRKDGKQPALPEPVAREGGASYFVVEELRAFVQQMIERRGKTA